LRSSARRTLLIGLAAVLIAVLALPASAGQIIAYRGETSQAKRIQLEVLKRESGRRFLRAFFIYFTVTCEDDTTGDLIGIGLSRRRGLRLGDNGEFQLDKTKRSFSYHFAGRVRFRSADGTFELNYAELTEDEQAQLCTTGVVDWSATRRGSRPAGLTDRTTPEGVTWLRIDRDGELVEVRRPGSMIRR